MNKQKPYYITLENKHDFLYVLVGGDRLTVEIAKMYWDEIAQRCDDLGTSKILIEKEFKQGVSPPEMLEMANYLSKVLAGAKIAFLDRYQNEINELGKVLARNQGVMMRLFDDIQEAEKWLAG